MQWKFIAFIGAIILAGTGLMVRALQESLVFYHPVKEVVSQPDTQKYQNIRLHGQVVPGSILRDATARKITFQAQDLHDHNFIIAVEHHGLEVPDMFKDRSEVVAEGSLTRPDLFESKFLMAKCPSKYETEFDADGNASGYTISYGDDGKSAAGEQSAPAKPASSGY